MSLEDATEQPEPSGSPPTELRQVTDAQTMRALAHPVRIELMEALTLHGPMTATQVGDLIGESATTCSFHLRQLAKFKFVEEAGGGKGRARPWKVSSFGMQLSTIQDDPDAALAAGALVRMVRDRQLRRYQTWRETNSSYPLEWQQATDDSEYVLYLTADELRQFGEEISELMLSRFRERLTDPTQRPAGALPVEMLFMSYPISPPNPKGDPS
jgi:DNA-binding transcriptional ArsR family regulator